MEASRRQKLFLRVNEKWAVSEIWNPPQWTLCQRHMRHGKEHWNPVSFCQTRGALLVAVSEKVIRGALFYRGSENLAVPGDLMAKIASFPERIDG